MCKAPKVPEPKEAKKPQFLRNRYLDEYVGDAQAVRSIRQGRASLRIPLGGPSPITGRNPTGPNPIDPVNPANVPPSGGDFTRSGGGGRVNPTGNPRIHLR